MLEDHKPDLPGECKRIKSAGLTMQTNVMRLLSDGRDPRGDSSGGSAADAAAIVHRVRKLDSNLLSASCTFGNFDYKSNVGLPPSWQAVVCTPDIAVQEHTYNEDLYMILACNGIWDVMSNKDVGRFVAGRVKKLRQDLSNKNNKDNKFPWEEVLVRVGDKLLTACLNAGSRDNMSVLIMAFLASGLAVVTFLSALLLELAAPKKEGANNIAVVNGVTRALAYE